MSKMTNTKVCITCKEDKPKTEYHKKTKHNDGRAYICKSCCSEYHQKRHKENPNRYTVKSHKWKKDNPKAVRAMNKRAYAKRYRIKEWVNNKYSGVPCLDCGDVFPFVAMDFDHRKEEKKEFNIARFGAYTTNDINITKVEKEIEKCDLICANCHRIRTFITRKK